MNHDLREALELLHWMRGKWRKHEDGVQAVLQNARAEEVFAWMDRVDALRTHGEEIERRMGGDSERVAFRYLHEIARGAFAWTRWHGMDELHHYGPDGNLVPGPSPDWQKVEYAYAAPSTDTAEVKR